MIKDRRKTILELIEKYEIQTQQQLADRLVEAGYDVTQATVSRDINELNLVKIPRNGGKPCYSVSPAPEVKLSDRFARILSQTVQEIKYSDNMIVVNTLSGCANAAAEAIDSTGFPEILGSIAGDNTIFIVVDRNEHVQPLVEKLRSYIG